MLDSIRYNYGYTSLRTGPSIHLSFQEKGIISQPYLPPTKWIQANIPLLQTSFNVSNKIPHTRKINLSDKLLVNAIYLVSCFNAQMTKDYFYLFLACKLTYVRDGRPPTTWSHFYGSLLDWLFSVCHLIVGHVPITSINASYDYWMFIISVLIYFTLWKTNIWSIVWSFQTNSRK